MTNLLPDQYKKKVRHEYAMRRAVVGLVMLTFLGLVFTASLFPSYMTAAEQKRKVEQELQQLQTASEEREIQTYLNQLKQANQLIQLLEPPESELRMYVVLTSILERSVSSVTLTDITIEKTEQTGEAPAATGGDDVGQADSRQDNRIRVFLSGVAETREGLTAFEQAVKGITFIDSVNLPVSELAARENIDFSMELTGSF